MDRYISQRRTEGVGDGPIAKELVALRSALNLALRQGLWRGYVDAVVPRRFAPAYKPRDRFLTEDELNRLLPQLPPDRAATVAFIVATSAKWGAVERARREETKNPEKIGVSVPKDGIEPPIRGFSRTRGSRVTSRKDKWLKVLKDGV